MERPTLRYIPAALLLCALASCANERSERSHGPAQEYAATDTAIVTEPLPGEALPLNSLQRKLIHAASVHAQVPQLYSATSRIESMTMQLGGQVAESRMEKAFREARTEREGSDSLRDFRRYSGVAVLSLRVPVAHLDTLLSYIAAQTSFIDNRQVRIDDATFRHLDNAMRNNRLDGSGQTVAGASRSDGLEARKYLDGQRSEVVTRQVDNLRLDDQAAYANISVELSQPDEVVSMVIPDINRLMQPGAWQRFVQSLRSGWELLYSLVLGLLGIWPITMLLVLGIILARRWYRRQQANVRVIKG